MEALNDETFRCRLDSLLNRLYFSGNSFKHHAPVISRTLLLAFLSICFFVFSRPRKRNHSHTRAALQALLTVVSPRCSLWPRRYVEFTSALRPRVNIPLEVIIEDTTNGVIEFRNPVSDLVDLMDSGVVVNGHTIYIETGWRWWVNYFEWRMLAKPESDRLLLHSVRYMLRVSEWPNTNMLAANFAIPGPSPSPFDQTLTTSRTVFCLDYLPQGTVPSLNVGCKMTLEFTAFSPSLRTISTAQVISAIPFINSDKPRRWPRGVVSVLKQLGTSYGPNLAIDSLLNVSVDYEHALCHVYKSFSGQPKNRETPVDTLEIKARRRDMFLVALEAALVRRRWIERWAIQVTVK